MFQAILWSGHYHHCSLIGEKRTQDTEEDSLEPDWNKWVHARHCQYPDNLPRPLKGQNKEHFKEEIHCFSARKQESMLLCKSFKKFQEDNFLT
jgi:hypothetical protein